MIYIVVSDGNELLALRHANLENDTLRMTRKRQKSIPRMDNEAKSTARAERIEIKYESLILAQLAACLTHASRAGIVEVLAQKQF